jgi:hypothetical protein
VNDDLKMNLVKKATKQTDQRIQIQEKKAVTPKERRGQSLIAATFLPLPTPTLLDAIAVQQNNFEIESSPSLYSVILEVDMYNQK